MQAVPSWFLVDIGGAKHVVLEGYMDVADANTFLKGESCDLLDQRISFLNAWGEKEEGWIEDILIKTLMRCYNFPPDCEVPVQFYPLQNFQSERSDSDEPSN